MITGKHYERLNEPTPNGGDYSEIYYYDKDGNPVDAEQAERCVIRECKNDGSLVGETIGMIQAKPPVLDSLLLQYTERFKENYPVMCFQGIPEHELIEDITRCIKEGHKAATPEESPAIVY